MKRIAFFLTSLLVLSFGLANGQGGSVSIQNVVGAFGAQDTVQAGVPIVFEIRFTNNTGDFIAGGTNGFRVYSPDGATWTPISMTETGAINKFPFFLDPNTMWDGGVFINGFSITGDGADTIGIGGFASDSAVAGIPDGFDEHVASITTGTAIAEAGKTLCLDSAFYRPANSWLWSLADTAAAAVVPEWDGPHCFLIYEVPNLAPVITNCPGALPFDHCGIASYDFDATDAENDPFTFSLDSGPGSIDAGTGEWTYALSLADVGGFAITVTACDAFQCSNDCIVDVAVSNAAPTITCPGITAVGKGNSTTVSVSGDAVDCDPITYSLGAISPTPVGTISIDPNTGDVTFDTDEADAGNAGQVFDIEVCVSDGDETACCTLQIDVLFTEPFKVCIERTERTFQGGHESVAITKEAGSEALGGFDFLISYDASALSFVGAAEGSVYSDCGWEYFNYRYGPNGNCGGGCPSGLLRVIGIAETNNGAAHPSCFQMASGDTFTTLDFLVSSDGTLECQQVPIRFFWLDCGDNTLSSSTGDSLFISRNVTDHEEIGDITNPASGYPTYTGAQDSDCFTGNENKVPVRFIDFCNGGISIACVDSIDARGDINLNEIANEISDAVLLSNYFIYGISVFSSDPTRLQGQIAASDVNADGLSLSVADLVYLIRIIVGDALPYPKVSPITAEFVNNNGTLNINADMGAALVIVEGDAVPTLLAENMEMKHNFDGINTRVLIYSMEAGASFSGDFLSVNGNVVSTEFAGYEGNIVVAKELPNSFALQQNYPNPFNPTTTVIFESKGGAYALSIYNVTGQKVAEYKGTGVGTIKIEVDGTGWSSGIYFYTLEIENFFKETKKMVLLK